MILKLVRGIIGYCLIESVEEWIKLVFVEYLLYVISCWC